MKELYKVNVICNYETDILVVGEDRKQAEEIAKEILDSIYEHELGESDYFAVLYRPTKKAAEEIISGEIEVYDDSDGVVSKEDLEKLLNG